MAKFLRDGIQREIFVFWGSSHGILRDGQKPSLRSAEVDMVVNQNVEVKTVAIPLTTVVNKYALGSQAV
jgi:hypothetical protein